jgi:hypothetical protein
MLKIQGIYTYYDCQKIISDLNFQPSIFDYFYFNIQIKNLVYFSWWNKPWPFMLEEISCIKHYHISFSIFVSYILKTNNEKGTDF